MGLPKINNVLYDLELPSSGEVIEYRPFLVKEEKILLMALEGKDEKEMVKAIKQIITQCVATEKFNVNKLAIVDLEYLFLNIRGKAVGDISTISFEHSCGETIKLDIDLSKVEVVQNKNSYTQWPNEKGYFGDFGGRYVSETLMPLIEEVEQEYNSVRNDIKFQKEFDYYLKNYVG